MKLSEGQIKDSPQTKIKWMCYDSFITIDSQVVDMTLNFKKEVLRGNSYCYFINGRYRTKKWIRDNCAIVLNSIYND